MCCNFSLRWPGAACVCAIVSLLGACSSMRVTESGGFAEIAVASATACDGRNASIRELRDARAKRVKMNDRSIRVPPGVYSLGISCDTPHEAGSAACAAAGATDSRFDIPPYQMVLEPGKRYLFSCAQVKGQDTVRLTDSPI